MKKSSVFALSVFALFVFFCFSACSTFDSVLPDSFSGNGGNQEMADSYDDAGDSVDTSSWDLSQLDTARNVDYMEKIEKDIVLEMNMARSNPRKYAEMYIAPRAANFNGNVYNGAILTSEGETAVQDCVEAMRAQSALPVLQPSKGLTQAAKDHASAQSLTSEVGHTGTDGSDPITRILRYGTTFVAGENISYGVNSAREIVVTLLIDDGVANRGHRKNILNANFKTVGVGFAEGHKLYDCECVIDYAGDYTEKQ